MASIDKLQLKRGLDTNLPTLATGEPGFTTDTKKLVIGAPGGNVEFLKKSELTSHVDDYLSHMVKESIVRSNKDVDGIFLTVERKRADGTLYYKSVLSGGTAPSYTTRTVTTYAADGITVLETYSFTIAYDIDNEFLTEILN